MRAHYLVWAFVLCQPHLVRLAYCAYRGQCVWSVVVLGCGSCSALVVMGIFVGAGVAVVPAFVVAPVW